MSPSSNALLPSRTDSTTVQAQVCFSYWGDLMVMPLTCYTLVIGYVPSGSHFVVLGSPLCDHDRRIETEVLLAFHNWCKSKKKSPLFLCVGALTQSILCEDLGYRGIQAAIEEVVPEPSGWDVKHNGDKEMRRHVRKAEEEIEVNVVKGEPDDDLRREIEEGIESWQAHRTGAQIHTSELKPWRDPEHRIFIYGRKRENNKVRLLLSRD